MNMSADEVECMPYGKMLDLISCYQISHNMVEEDFPFDDESVIPDLK